MEEAYVSFEVARLLKEKGFNGECHKYYWGYFHGKEFLTEGTFNPEYDYPAPTLQMAMAWLREKHRILISIDAYKANHYEGYIDSFEIDIFKNASHIIVPREIAIQTNYEEAVEAALEYVLKNLI